MCLFMFNKPLEHAVEYINNKFGKRNPVVAEANVLALKAGHNYAHNTHAFANTYDVQPADLPKGRYRSINGNQATAWGFIAASEKSGRAALLRFVSHHPRDRHSRRTRQAQGPRREDRTVRG